MKDSSTVTACARAINLVGMTSEALVEGGAVTATGTGANYDPICTATDNPVAVTNAKIAVTGGVVSSANDYAIHATGAKTQVAVSGGQVSTTTGNAIHAIGKHQHRDERIALKSSKGRKAPRFITSSVPFAERWIILYEYADALQLPNG